MLKKLLSTFFAVTMMLCLSCQALTTDQQEADSLLDPETLQEIFHEYSDEIKYIEDTYEVEINNYTDVESNIIKQAALEAYDTVKFERLSQLATDLAVAKSEYAIQDEPINTNRSGPARTPVYVGSTVVYPFGPLKGEFYEEVAIGQTATHDVNIHVEISSGETIKEFLIAVGADIRGSVSVEGPEDGTLLSNGMVATHRVVTGILAGTIVERFYQDIDPWTGAYMGEYSEYAVIDEIGYSCTHLAHIGSPMYVENYTTGVAVRCDNINDFINELETNPELFI